MKMFICGHGRHGKDTVAEILRDFYGLKFESSSHFAMRACVRDGLALRHGLRYATEAHCYEDRINHRSKWFDLICEYNRKDPARLAREMFKVNDIYVGIRNRDELDECKRVGLADLVIWVDATERVGAIEGWDSNTVTPEDCDFTVLNNGTEEDLKLKISRIFTKFGF